MGYEVTARAPRAPIIQPRPRPIPEEFTAGNIRIMLATRVGIGRDADFPSLDIAGAASLTPAQARAILAAVGTTEQSLDILTDDQVVTLADTLIPTQDRITAARVKVGDITKVPITTTIGAPSTSRISAASTITKIATPAAARIAAAAVAAGTIVRQTATPSDIAIAAAAVAAGTIVKQTAKATTGTKSTGEQTPKPQTARVDYPKTPAEAKEEAAFALPIDLRNYRTGRSVIVGIVSDQAIAGGGTQITISAPIPFPCLLSWIHAFTAPFPFAAGYNYAIDIIGQGPTGFTTFQSDVPAYVTTQALIAGDGDVNMPIHILVPFAGAQLRLISTIPALGNALLTFNVTADEVALPAKLLAGFSSPRGLTTPQNLDRQMGVTNVRKPRITSPRA